MLLLLVWYKSFNYDLIDLTLGEMIEKKKEKDEAENKMYVYKHVFNKSPHFLEIIFNKVSLFSSSSSPFFFIAGVYIFHVKWDFGFDVKNVGK